MSRSPSAIPSTPWEAFPGFSPRPARAQAERRIEAFRRLDRTATRLADALWLSGLDIRVSLLDVPMAALGDDGPRLLQSATHAPGGAPLDVSRLECLRYVRVDVARLRPESDESGS